MGPELPEEERAERIARQWLARYGIVSRDWWRRERPPITWRAIYRELKRLEFRGEIRRGYFVKGLGGRNSRYLMPWSGSEPLPRKINLPRFHRHCGQRPGERLQPAAGID
jgi:hypothetical protein